MTSRKDLYLLHPFYQGYIADGFHSDCGMLIQRCLQCDRLNFETFCKIWKEMNFDCLYQGRLSGAEIAELSEELIHIGKQYMLADNTNFEETVAGLFIVYSLLNLQPYSGFAALRLVPEDVPRITHIEMVARRDKRLDVLYILGSVLIKGPCQYHAAREYGMEHSYKKYLQGYSDVDKVGVRSKGVFYTHPEELSLLRDLAGITSRYVEAKEAIAGNKQTELSLRFINNTLANELEESLRNVITGIGEDGEQDLSDDDDDLNLKEFHQISDTMEKSTDNEKHVDHELDIQIESIPIYIRTDEGKSIEIELVDQYEGNQKSRVGTDSTKLTVIAECSKNNEEDAQKQTNDENPIDQSDSFIIKPPKRDQIKRHLKSKFKRMGMLPVANFKETEREENE
ncbi:LOW QUALITY PROTEIN: uncharacterized protein ACR2FA_010121 [Aphomia sociella]